MHGARTMGWLVMLTLGACVGDPEEAADSDSDPGDSDSDLPPVDSDTDIPERPYFDPPAGQSACVLTPEAPTMADTMTVTSTGLTDPDPTDGVAVDVRYEWWVYERGTLNDRRDPRGNEANALGSTAPPWGATRPSCDDANFPMDNVNYALSCRVGSVLYAKCIAFDAFGDGEVALSAEITIVGDEP